MIATTPSHPMPPCQESKNPWLGLASYTEQDRHIFFGREREIRELSRLIGHDTLTILFGRSGYGKTSLLRAGIVPQLDHTVFFPVYVRIDYAEHTSHPIEQIKSMTLDSAKSANIELEGLSDNRPGATLWEFFHTIAFWSTRNDQLTPVLIFDQFEEVFTLGRGVAYTNEFLEQLADLAENRVPRELIVKAENDEGCLPFTPTGIYPKIILSLREDYVSKLDELRTRMPAIMRNRLAMQPLAFEDAVKVVTGPGGNMISDEVAHAIVKSVAGIADETEKFSHSKNHVREIEPAYLSVMCHELFRRMLSVGETKISSDLVKQEHGDILEDMYERSFEDIRPVIRLFLEDRLLTPAGFRTSVPLPEASREGVSLDDLAILVNRRLLRFEDRLGTRHVELSHDLLTRIVQRSRDHRQEKEAIEQEKRLQIDLRRKLIRTRSYTMIVLAMAVLSSGILVFLSFGYYFDHVFYCKDVEKRYGSIYPIDILDNKAVTHRNHSIKVTQKGWFGQIKKLEMVDSLGNRRDNIGFNTYLSDSHSDLKKPSLVEFIYDRDDRVVYEVSRDRNNKMVWGFIYTPCQKSKEHTQGMFVGWDGYPQPQGKSRTSFVKIKYDAMGHEIEMRYIGRGGKPAPGPDGAFGRKLEYDTKGRVERMIALDAGGKPMIDEFGNAELFVRYDREGNLVESRLLDTIGELIPSQSGGYAIAKYEYDKWGNIEKCNYFDAYDNPVINKEIDAHSVVITYDTNGNIVNSIYYGLKQQDKRNHWDQYNKLLYHKVEYEYDRNNQLISERYYDKSDEPTSNYGWHEVKYIYNKVGNINEIKYFNTNQKECQTEDGYHCVKYVIDEFGQQTEERYFAADGITPACIIPGGYHIKRNKFNEDGMIIETSYFDTNKKPCASKKNGAHRYVMDYDASGKMIMLEYWGKTGRTNSLKGFHRKAIEYDRFGNKTKERYFKTNGKDVMPGVGPEGIHQVVKTYDDKYGLLKEEILLGPLNKPIENKFGIHRTIYKFNTIRKETKHQYFRINGSPAEDKYRIHLELTDYNARGRKIRTTQLGKNGEAAYDRSLGIATLRMTLDANGIYTVQAFYDVKDNLKMGPFGFAKGVRNIKRGYEECINYDEKGQIIFNKLIGWAIRREDNTKNWLSQTTYLGSDHKPIQGPEGYAEYRRELAIDSEESIIKEQYFDAENRPAYGPDGYHLKIKKYSKSGPIQRHFFDIRNKLITDINAVNMINFFYVSEITSVHAPAIHSGLQAGDILWKFADWSFPEALEKAKQMAEPDKIAEFTWQGFLDMREKAKQGSVSMTVIRNGQFLTLSVPKLTGDGLLDGLLGININNRSIPRKDFENLILRP